MNTKSHLVITIPIFVGLWIVFNVLLGNKEFTMTQSLAAIAISLYPNIDENIKSIGHRSWVTHGILIWVIIWLFNMDFIFIQMILAIGIHCLLDLRYAMTDPERSFFFPITLIGYKTLKEGKWEWKHVTTTPLWSVVWLTINFIVSVIIFLIALMFY